MSQINAKIDDHTIEKFRDVIYKKKGLKKGDFKESLEEAMLDYIAKYSKAESAKQFVKHYKEMKKAS